MLVIEYTACYVSLSTLVERHITENEHYKMQTLKMVNLHKGLKPKYKGTNHSWW
jgi:hypothetical protein